jgi:hypothetical protein
MSFIWFREHRNKKKKIFYLKFFKHDLKDNRCELIKKRSLKTGRTLQINAFNLENQINWNRNNKKKHIHHQVSFREYKQYIDYFQNSHFLSRKKNEVVKNIEYLHSKYNYFFFVKVIQFLFNVSHFTDIWSTKYSDNDVVSTRLDLAFNNQMNFLHKKNK